MCGIAGFTRRFGAYGHASIHRLLEELIHRGPDEQGVFESRNAALGTVRLRVVDPVGGRQPMMSADDDVAVVCNGEIYNSKELREELAALGHCFNTRSDTEVVLHAFLEWDVLCFARLRGMFAIAAWQESKRRLVLGRDRLGIKPLYVCLRAADICFASEIKAILAHPGVEREVDLDALNCYLDLNYVPTPHTLFRGIQKLAPAHWLEWNDGVLRSAAFWPVSPGRRAPMNEEEAVEELDRLLTDAVADHLISDVPLGIWLSGGLDSSTILHYAAEASPRKLATFSVSFAGRSCDESRFFREVACHYGTDHQELDLNPDLDLVSAIEQLPYYHDEPGGDAGALPIWFLAQMSRRKATVVLSGEGADELFGGYLTYSADRLLRPLQRIPAFVRAAAARAVSYLPVSDAKIGFDYKLKRFLEGSLLSPDEAHIFWNGGLSQRQKAAIFAFADPVPLRDLLSRFASEHDPGTGLNRNLLFDRCFYLSDNILAKVDRMSMAHSLEVRPPFLDHRIVEFAASLPARMKIRDRSQKYLLRKLMERRLPPAVLRRKKEGFDIPAHEWLRGPLRSLLLDTLLSENAAVAGLFRPAGLRALIDAHLERRANVGYQLWGLLILFLWLRRWKVGVPEEGPRRLAMAQPDPLTAWSS